MAPISFPEPSPSVLVREIFKQMILFLEYSNSVFIFQIKELIFNCDSTLFGVKNPQSIRRKAASGLDDLQNWWDVITLCVGHRITGEKRKNIRCR